MAKKPKYHITHFKSIEIKGYKSIKHLTVDLLPGLNVLIGKNNAGKTNFLDCLNHILFIHDRKKVPFSLAAIDMISSNRETFTWQIIKSANDKISIDGNTTYLSEEKNLHNNNVVFDTTASENGTKKSLKREILVEPLNLLPQEYDTSKPVWTYIRYNFSKNFSLLKEPGQIIFRKVDHDHWIFEDSWPFINYFLLPLPSIPQFLNEEKISKNNIKNILLTTSILLVQIDRLSKFSPIQNLRLNENINIFQNDEIIRIENLFLEFLVEGTWMPWSNLSDGTKRIFYLLFEVARIKEGVVLIDEPELGIHPHQLFQLMLFLKEEAEQKQIIMATHAPQTLDFISPEELNRIFITSYDKKLGTQIRPLTDKQKEKAQQYMKENFLRDYWLASDLEV